MMSREEVILLSTRIADLRSQVKRLGELQRELRRLEAQLDGALGGALPSESGPPAENAPTYSLNERIVEFLSSHPEKTWSAEAIQIELKAANLNSVRSGLSKLVAAGRAAKASRGRYHAAPKPRDETQELKEAV